MGAVIEALDTALNFIYNNILSIAMLVLLIAVGLFLTIRLGYVMKNTVGSLFQKNQHEKDSESVSPFQAVTTAPYGTSPQGAVLHFLYQKSPTVIYC